MRGDTTYMQNYEFHMNVTPMFEDVFYRTYGKNTRLELKNGMFDKGKLAILLQKLDNNNKQVDVLTLYIDLPKALVMANDILSGRFSKMATDKSKITTVFKDMGGKPAERANRPDGKPIYRELSIQKGNLWIIRGVQGPGKVTSTGGFAPDGHLEHQISIGMDSDTLKAIALTIQSEYQAFRTSKFYMSLSTQPVATDYSFATINSFARG